MYPNLPLVSSAENEEIRLTGLECVSMVAEKLWKKILSLETDKLTSSTKNLKETKNKATGWNRNCKALQASVICQNFMHRAKGKPDENIQTNNKNNKKLLKNAKIEDQKVTKKPKLMKETEKECKDIEMWYQKIPGSNLQWKMCLYV